MQNRNESLMQECIAYFKERPVYRKLFKKIREKYVGLGHFGGTVQLTGLSQEERQQLGGFFQKDYMGKKVITISAVSMQKALEGSRFQGLEWEDILQEYFQEELVAKKEQQRLEEVNRKKYFADIIERCSGPGVIWLEKMLAVQGDAYPLLMKQYREQPETFREILVLSINAISKLPFLQASDKQQPTVKELLAVFAAKTTGNPHFFDTGTVGEQLLFSFLRDELGVKKTAGSFQAEKKAWILYEGGLLKDELSNNTLAYGVRAWTKDGTEHEGIAGFLTRREPLQLTLLTLGTLGKVCTQKGNGVYIVENPAVFSKLIQMSPNATVLCGNGQIRLATLVLMDLFEEENIFYYAGDFDPEGLQIAQNLKERYGERLQLWKYSIEYYHKYRSKVEVSEKSLKKLDKIYVEELQEIKRAILTEKRAAYQEAMMEELLSGELD